MVESKESDLVASINSLAALEASGNRDAEAESLYKDSIAVLDKHEFVASHHPAIDPADPPPPLLAETLDQYAALLKKMRKTSDAARIEERVRILRGGGLGASSQKY